MGIVLLILVFVIGIYLGNRTSYRDSLTRLPNRKRIKQYLQRSYKRQGSIAVLYGDFDDFASFNDVHGHEAANLLLKEFATRLRAAVRGAKIDFGLRSVLAARMHGDEFIVIIRDIQSADVAQKFARCLIAELKKSRYQVGEREYDLEVSFGVVWQDCVPSNPMVLTDNADTAMRDAKLRLDHVRLYDAKLQREVEQRELLRLDLKDAVARDDWRIVMMPTIDLKTGHIVGAEANLRFEGDGFDGVSTERLFEVIEELQLTEQLMPRVLRKVGNWLAERRAQGLQLFVIAVNFSPRQLHSETSFAAMTTVLMEMPEYVRPYIMCEFTERYDLGVDERTSQRLTCLEELGVHLALDDFGTGHAAVQYLLHYPQITVVKVPKIYMDGATANPDDTHGRQVLGGLIRYLHELPFTAVCEGVETMEQAVMLRDDFGCRRVQGHIFYPPQELDEFEELLRRQQAGQLEPFAIS